MKTEFEINLNSPTFLTDTIRLGIEQLMSMRNRTSKRAELEWEIRLYRYILRQNDPEAAAREYFTARKENVVSKREVVKILKWKVT